MLLMQRKSRLLESEVSKLTAGLLENSITKLVWAFLAVGLVTWSGIGIFNVKVIFPPYFLIAILLVALSALTLWRLPRNAVQALVGWLIGITLIITMAVIVYPHSFIALFYIVIPLIVVVLLGWQAGLLADCLMIGLVAILSRLNYLPPFTSALPMTVMLGSILLGIIGQATFDSFYIYTHWAVYYAQQAKESLEKARNQQEELFQIQADLITANEEVSRLLTQYKALQQVAEDARQAKTEFVSIVSHELRAPLNMIIGFSEMITRTPRSYGAKVPAALLADIGIIHRNAVHLSRLINDVLDLSQIEAGRMALSKEKTDVKFMVEAAVNIIRPLYESKKLFLKMNIPEPLPLLYCDGMRIRQILVNLLSNAGRFTQAGGASVRVTQIENWLVFNVSDSGPGISKEDQAQLFEPFQQVDTSIRREHGGSGLGLSISKKFVEMHGGTIELESELGKGTSITFRLPVDTLPISAEKLSEAYKRWSNPFAQVEARDRSFNAPLPVILPQIALVEKGDALHHLFSRYTENLTIASFDQLEAAITFLDHSPSQALIINQAEFSTSAGYDILQRKLVELPDTMPVISCWLPGKEEASSQMGVIDYLVKPVTNEVLIKTVKDLSFPVKKILMIDDEPDLLQLFSRELTSEGYRVWRAENAGEGLEVMRDRHPDLIFLDMILPGMNGRELLAEKSNDPGIRSIPVIVISAQDTISAVAISPTILVGKKNGFSTREFLDFIQSTCLTLSLRT